MVVVCGGTVGGLGTSSLVQVGVHPQDKTSSYSYNTSVPFLHFRDAYLISIEVGLQQEHPPSPVKYKVFEVLSLYCLKIQLEDKHQFIFRRQVLKNFN